MAKIKALLKKKDQNVVGIIIIVIISILGVKLLIFSHAESPYASVQAESGSLSGVANTFQDPTASNSSAVKFGSTPTTATSITVDGDQLLNGQGQPIRLLGVDAASTESACIYNGESFAWYGETLDGTEASAIRAWKANAVRVPLNEDCWLGINGVNAAYSGANYQAAIESWVQAINNAGMVAILDLHWSAPGTTQSDGQYPSPDEDHSPTFWTQVATDFKSDPGVMFDLFNEPYLGDSDALTSTPAWQCWLDGCTVTDNDFSPTLVYTSAGVQQLVNDVRATGATQPIELGGINWSADPCGYYGTYGSTASCPQMAYMPTDPLNQLVVSYHSYLVSNSCSTQSCWDSLWNYEYDPIKSAGYPFVTDEFGEDDCNTQFMNWYMSWADQNNLSYMAWSWLTTIGACSDGAVENWYLLDDWAGDPSTNSPQGANFKSHLNSVSPY